MTSHSSAGVRETPHAIRKSRTNTIVDALKRRVEAVLNDKSIDSQSRAIIRYALEINDPWLARLVRRAEAGEEMFEELGVEEIPEADNGDSHDEKIAALMTSSVASVTSPTLNPPLSSCSWRQLKTPRTRKRLRAWRNTARLSAAPK